MFTGIVEELGKIKSISDNKLTVECGTVLEDAKLGDSIAVNGVCLTVTNIDSKTFTADISPETYKVTNLKNLQAENHINLERAMNANGRFGGHIVSGHVDGLGKVISCIRNSNFYDLKIELNEDLFKYVIKKGSITIDGISLTIANLENNVINLAIIPHTYEKTNIHTLKSGDYVNIEVDIVAKYIEKFLSTSDNKSRISLEFLQEHGF